MSSSGSLRRGFAALIVAVPLTGFVAAGASAATGDYALTATSTGSGYSPTFTGNGELGVRVPPAGQGYAGGTVPAQSELAGFYAKPSHGKPSDRVQQRANTPTWSTLTFTDGSASFAPKTGQTSGWHQTLDLHSGVITTRARWTAPDGHVSDLRYDVFTDRARLPVGVVRLMVTPRWTGTASVSDLIDGTPATLTTQVGKGWDDAKQLDWVEVATTGTNIKAALASRLVTSSNVAGVASRVSQSKDQSVGRRVTFPVTSGQTYVFTKYVAVEDAQTTSDPVGTTRSDAADAANRGYAALRAENDAAWARLWTGAIDVLGNRQLASEINASEFYLWSSTTTGVNWSVSPAGLSSNGYDGHIFWDAETWMYPSLLAQHPDVAAGMNAYRFDRLSTAMQHAKATGHQGGRFPWESALDGTEQIPPPVSVNSEGVYEQHITADIALAQWQYYLATGDRLWLRSRGWPVLRAAATFWASRVRKGHDGRYHLDHITGPDEENVNVNDEAYTNVGARTTLLDAAAAAQALGVPAPSSWTRIANGLVVLNSGGLHPEYAGYRGQLVKQADVTLMQYPWAFPMSRAVGENDLGFYVPRNDPDGPSMTDAVSSIDSSALGTPGCASYVYTQRSVQPFLRDVFNQFSETRKGGAFTFMTGIGGFLQEFLYGYSGMRWQAGSVHLDPSLTRQLSGVVLHNLMWRGRRFTVTIGQRHTTVRLDAGAALPVSTRRGSVTITPGHPAIIATRRPDLSPTDDSVRCGTVTASSSQPGAPPLAAIDGSTATDWQPATLPASVTVSGATARPVRRVTVVWGRQWPPQPKPNVHPPVGPVTTLRATSYTLQVSRDGRRWRTVARVSGRRRGPLDTFGFRPVRARFARLRITQASSAKLQPMVQELMLTG